MSSFNDSANFMEQEFLFYDTPKEWREPESYTVIKLALEEVYREEQTNLEALVENIKSTLLSSREKIKIEEGNIEKRQEKKNLLFTKVISAKQSLDELLLRKNALKAEPVEIISKDELSEIFQKVVHLEKEQELRKDEMKMKLKVFIGQMCFYKEYLDIYVDMTNSNDFMLYFRKCRTEDNNKPQEWIQIKTDDFKKFLVVDLSSRGRKSDDLLKKIKSSDKYLREIIIEVREMCLNVL